MRRCMGCNEPKPKSELVRIVRTPDGEIKLDRTGKLNGRGAYICDSTECLNRVRKNGRISRNFGVAVPSEIFDELEKELNNR